VNDAGDVKTLRMASPEVSEAWVSAYLRYQSALLASLERGDTDAGPSAEARLAQAHHGAREASGLQPEALSRLQAVCADYCGRLRTAEELRRALDGGNVDEERAKRARLQLRILEDWSAFRSRYGDAAVDALEQQKGPLLDFHRRLTLIFQNLPPITSPVHARS